MSLIESIYRIATIHRIATIYRPIFDKSQDIATKLTMSDLYNVHIKSHQSQAT